MHAHLPEWLQSRLGNGRVLLVAPHGGRARAPAGQRPTKVNDLHTAELTLALAQRLDATAIVNVGLDRNELDLNRITQVLRHAPWFLTQLESTLHDMLRRHAEIEVLFIHGWNVTQRKCDIGIGRRLDSHHLAGEHAQALTVCPAYVQQRLETFRVHCSAAGIQSAYGARYPASHPNNILQLFRRGDTPPRASAAPQLAAWASAGRVQAVQIELGVPLRWAGAERERFMTAVVQAFEPARTLPSPASGPPVAPVIPPMIATLSCADPAARIGVMVGVRAEPDGRSGARVMLFLGARRVALFTGEEAAPGLPVFGGPCFRPNGEGFTVSFDGPALEVDDGTRYVDLEWALAHGRLLPTTIDLTFEPGADSRYGRVAGTLRLGSRRMRIDTFGFRDAPLLQRVPASTSQRLVFTAAFGGDDAIAAQSGQERGGRLTHFARGNATTHPLAAFSVSNRGNRPRRFAVSFARSADEQRTEPLVIRPTSVTAIRRPAGRGRWDFVTFGLARFDWRQRGRGAGFYEYSRRVDPSTSSG